MAVLETLGLAVGLGMDAMSVCASVGVRWHGPRQKFRLAWHMGLFQFLMPVLGWAGGQELAYLLKSVGTYLAAGLVFLIGAKMLWEALRSHPGAMAEKAENLAASQAHVKPRDPTRGWSLVALSVVTSLDALVAGFSLGLKGAEIWTTSAIIGLAACAMALTGVIVGQRAGQAFGRHAELAGALVLMALGVGLVWL